MARPFRDRAEAGRQLSALLRHLRGTEPIVLGLPPGGALIAAEVARTLGGIADVLNVRALGVSWDPKLCIGAMGTGDVRVLTSDRAVRFRFTREDLDDSIDREQEKLNWAEQMYRKGRDAPDLQGRTVILVADGIVTSREMRTAIMVVRAQRPSHLVVAVPVAEADSLSRLAGEVDEVFALHTPQRVGSLDLWYDDASPLTYQQVRRAVQSPHRARQAV